MGLLCLGAAGPVWRRPASGEVAVMVDLSPSTRLAEYRKRATLESRIRQLLGGVPFRMYYFADGLGPANAPVNGGAGDLPDIAAERTRYEPPPGSAVLLFSDGQFSLGSAATSGSPTYPVIDIGLEDPHDAAIVRLESHKAIASVSVRNTGPDRRLSLPGSSGTLPAIAPVGEYVISRPIDESSGFIAAQFDPGDAWPENDRLTAPVPRPRVAEKWLVDASGALTAPPGWRVMSPEMLPTDPAVYLARGDCSE